MERCIDQCAGVAHVLESVVLKHCLVELSAVSLSAVSRQRSRAALADS